MPAEARARDQMSFSIFLPYCLVTNCKSPASVRLVSQKALGSISALQCSSYRHVLLCLDFTWELGIQLMSFCLHSKCSFPLNCLIFQQHTLRVRHCMDSLL